MAGLWYRAGTVAVTNASKKVVGTGTTWKSGASKPDKGHTVWAPDGKAYELDYVESDTVLYLVTAYGGMTASGMTYSIDISRSGTNSAFSRDLSAFVAYHQLQMDGWQQLFTGTGDVTLTAPDGTKLTVPSWEKVMNAGTGVVAQAKTEADRAKTEANKAAASATAAGDVVAASVLPLPDVWVPLNDSLRMITGYGRNVTVGDDVVARMVTFSRNSTRTRISKDGVLKTAAVNEPCFEKEGLHLDIQSTNLFPWSQEFVGKWVLCNGVVKADAGFPNAVALNNDMSGFVHTSAGALVIGTTYTISAIVTGYVEGVTALRAVFSNVIEDSWSVTGKFGPYTILSFKKTVTENNAGQNVTGLRWPVGKVAGVVLCAMQIEALPVATSYIPTNGAAATRAADVLQFVGAANHPDILSGVPFTLAMRMSCDELVGSGQRDVLVCQNVGYSLLRRVGSLIRYYRDGSGQLSVSAPGKKMNVVAVRVTTENNCTLRVGASQLSRTEVPITSGKVATIDITNVAGHVRDFRIWHHSVTDEQFKAIQ
ncbi:MAG: hypothetical protein KA754_03715 [Corallincola sp.]|nr:hypothetical protein [Corallincola sp.]